MWQVYKGNMEQYKPGCAHLESRGQLKPYSIIIALIFSQWCILCEICVRSTFRHGHTDKYLYVIL